MFAKPSHWHSFHLSPLPTAGHPERSRSSGGAKDLPLDRVGLGTTTYDSIPGIYSERLLQKLQGVPKKTSGRSYSLEHPVARHFVWHGIEHAACRSATPSKQTSVGFVHACASVGIASEGKDLLRASARQELVQNRLLVRFPIKSFWPEVHCSRMDRRTTPSTTFAYGDTFAEFAPSLLRVRSGWALSGLSHLQCAF